MKTLEFPISRLFPCFFLSLSTARICGVIIPDQPLKAAGRTQNPVKIELKSTEAFWEIIEPY